MVGRAGPFLAGRSLTALIAVAMVASGLTGMFIVGKTATASGDLIVTDDATYVIRDLRQFVDGNVVVTEGTLKIIDGTLSVVSNYDQRYTITVGLDGTLILDHGVITTHLDQLNPWAELEIIVEDGGVLIATNESVLQFPGSITIQDGGEVSLSDTLVTALPSDVVSQYVVGSAGLITLDSANDGPQITVTDSTLKLFDSTIEMMPEFPGDGDVAGNLTLNGGSTLLAVNSYIEVDFGPAMDAGDWYTHNCLVLNDESKAYLYGTYFEEYGGILADRAPAIVVSGVSTSPAVPVGIGSLASVDTLVYAVDPAETLEVTSWDVGGVLGTLEVSSATLVATYSVDPAYNGDNAIQWRPDAGVYSDTSIVPDSADPAGTMATYDLPLASLATVADVAAMDVRFINGGSTGSVQFDALWVVFSVGGNAYIYRWMNATAGDEYGVPIPNATISAVFTGATDLEGQEAFYYTADGVSVAPDPDVLAYMGEDETSFKTTKAEGKTVLPYLTDIIVSDGSLNSQFVGSYAISAIAVIDSVEYSSTESFSFPTYPAMEGTDQYSSITVDVMGVSVPSPDYSRWLVVPLITGEETLTIEDMEYYHAGDVIVASDGELIFLNSELLMVQDYEYERTIYVDGNGRLVFENSVIRSGLPINIIVQGFGTLEVINSELQGLNIIAKEDAIVVLSDSTMSGGKITTSWNSRASISVYDCILTQSPVLSGYTVGAFTNSSIPSIVVQGDARALIYRWIHVTVLDGNLKPLPNVLVSARFFVNNSLWISTLSDSTGVAKLNCLGTIITEAGSSYIGNYRVNATYWFNDTAYESDQEVSVGVKPYSEPLTENATYATLTILAALPDLEIATSGAVTCSPVMPMNGQATTVTAAVENTGISVAYNVKVDYYDDNQLFATVIHPSIAPNTTADVIATWLADEPLSPDSHSIKVVVDADDTITEYDEAPAIGYAVVYVQNLPDVVVLSDPSLYTIPSEPIVDSECMLITRLINEGDNVALNIPVAFYSVSLNLIAPEFLIGETIVDSIPRAGTVTVSVPWTPDEVKMYTVSVVVNEDHSVPEISFDNNAASFDIAVYDYPDLALSSFSFNGVPTIAGGDTILVRATLSNLEASPVVNPEVALYVDSTESEPYDVFTYSGVLTNSSAPVVVDFVYEAPVITDTVQYMLIMVANPFEEYDEQTRSNNNVSGLLNVTDVRADLVITTSMINITYNGAEIFEQMFGRTVDIGFDVENLGSRTAIGMEMIVSVRGADEAMNYTIETLTGEEVPGGSTVSFSVPWTINLTTPGDYWICVEVDSTDAVSEPDEGNNYAEAAFTVAPLSIDVTITSDDNEYATGTTMTVEITVLYDGTTQPVVGLHVRMALYDSSQNLLDSTVTPSLSEDPLMTDSNGQITALLGVPDIPSGNYYVGVMIQGVDFHADSSVSISGDVSGGGIPLFIWIIVILAIVGVVAGFTIYTYVYGLGKLVECGECGAFIPAASKRCPKCGVEFEVGTMKCSECGAWVPSDAGECPNCGVKFVGEPGGEDMDYLERMKSEYEAMVSEYRELAKEDLGKKFSDKKFEEWWKSQPTYISFDDWLAKEEEKRKEGPMACPVCGTLNPREATVCHKCGTVFAPAEEEMPPEGGAGMPPAEPVQEAVSPDLAEQPPQVRRPPEGGAGAAGEQPRMVIRRPIDRKVVPKKIIRQPVDKESEE